MTKFAISMHYILLWDNSPELLMTRSALHRFLSNQMLPFFPFPVFTSPLIHINF